MTYKEIFEKIHSLKIKELVDFYPIDIYDLGDSNSITIRFILQTNKTLQEDEINAIMEQILKALEEKGISLR